MALYKQKEEPVQQNTLCHTGYTVCERVMMYIKSDKPTQLGVKRFHCLRRFTLDCIKGQCDKCTRDMTRECFFIKKEYYSPELVDLLIKVYIDDARKLIGASTIWKQNVHFDAIMLALKYPRADIKVDHYMKENEVTF